MLINCVKNEFISLGGACDVGIALQWMRVKGPSYPFDWLANLDGGLSVVIDILENDFEAVNKRDCYETRYFAGASKSYIVYKNHPEVVHLHSDPLADCNEHEALVRRMERFKIALQDRGLFINFLYYRSVDSLKLKEGSVSLEAATELLRSEGQRFVRFVQKTYPGRLFSLTLVMQAPMECWPRALSLLTKLNGSNKVPEIKYGFTIVRPDEDRKLKALWRRQWCEIVLRCCRLSLPQRIYISLRWLQQVISFLFKR